MAVVPPLPSVESSDDASRSKSFKWLDGRLRRLSDSTDERRLTAHDSSRDVSTEEDRSLGDPMIGVPEPAHMGGFSSSLNVVT